MNYCGSLFGRHEGLAEEEIGVIIVHGIVDCRRALNLVNGNRVGAESCGDIDAHLLSSYAAEVEANVYVVKTVSYYLIVGCAAYHCGPLT